jgi:hypothetical protein
VLGDTLDFGLGHKGTADDLLCARQALLAKDNPLGLVYTLYGSLDLKV